MISDVSSTLSQYEARNVDSSAGLQILTIQRAFLTALPSHTPDNGNYGGNNEAEHPAQLKSNRVEGVAVCNQLGHPLYLTIGCPQAV